MEKQPIFMYERYAKYGFIKYFLRKYCRKFPVNTLNTTDT